MNEFWQMFWWMIEFFLIVAYLIILFNILSDLFRDHETGGFVKAIWIFFLLFVPFLTAFLYVVIRGKGMAERSVAAHAQAKSQADTYIREVAGTGPAAEIATAKNLLDSGAITVEEFEALKARALA
ncbi:MAG: SHOCT domain-containing protein [Actinomycetales bacterium]|nr:SHOCT domain-containing protein [Actinomycetales bacterium]